MNDETENWKNLSEIFKAMQGAKTDE